MMVHWEFMGWMPEIGNVYKLWKITMFQKITMLLMGQLTVSTGPFSIAMLNYQKLCNQYQELIS